MNKMVHLTDMNNLPLSSNQQRLWILGQQDKTDPSYNIHLAYHLEGVINVETFNKSMNLLFEKQFTLFSVFRQHHGVPYIAITPKPVFIDLIDFSVFPLREAREKILSFACEKSRIPFDLENGPLYRMFLLKETEQSWFFCMTIHHIIFDGFSRRLFVLELSRIYSNLLLGVDEVNEPLKFQSYDFAALETETASIGNEKEITEYWQGYLKDSPQEIQFPYDFQRSNNPTRLGCKEPFQISPEISQKLRKLSQESKSSVFKTLLSILGILFDKSTGVNDICIGIPVSNRRSSESFKTFGFFVDTIPVRQVIDGNNDFSQHISYLTEVFNKTLLHSVSFDKIVGILKPERIPGLNPFFQVCFSWINNFTIPMDLGGVTGKRFTMPNGVAAFDITFAMWEDKDFICGEIEYSTDVLTRETIIRLRDNFLVLIRNLVEYPNTPIGSLAMITEEDRMLIERINETSTDYPKDKTIGQLFEEQASLYPDKTAIVSKDSFLTYSQLNQKSNQLAHVLRNSGVKTGDPVAILVDKSVDMIVGIFGILKAGGAYVPIDPDYPEDRKIFIIRDSGSRILITQDKYINEHAEDIVKYSLDSSSSYHNDKSNVEKNNLSSDLAYIIYTSGTTGNPKGTFINHRGVVRLVRNTNYLDITPEDRVLQSSSVVFDASTVEIFGTLLNGATLYIVDKETLLNPDALEEVLIKNNITEAVIATALFNQLAEKRADIFRNLRYLMVGGEALSAPHVNKVRKHNPLITFINAYGPTENSCNSTTYAIERDFDSNIPIGKPISNSTAYIFDKNMNYQPVGIIGELYVGGDGVSPGYLNRDDLNRRSFVQHPFKPGERLYRTGDYARWLPDGNIEFHGRIDNQIKIRGFRIELEEIETALMEIDGIKGAVVKPVKIDAGDVRLVAFLDVPSGANIDFTDLNSRIKSKLPAYMIPSAYKAVKGFPISINGKIDRKALSIDLSAISENESTVDLKELSDTQKQVLSIWQDIIKVRSIGINDNFFDVGGTSFLAVRVVDRIEKEFNVNLGLREFFFSPKIHSLAETIEWQKNPKRASDGVSEKQQNKTGDEIIKGEL